MRGLKPMFLGGGPATAAVRAAKLARDTLREGESAVHDFMTLKYAIYFIMPAVVLYVIASVCAPVLTLTAQMVIRREVSQDAAACMMAIVIAASAGVAAMVHWIAQVLWVTLAAGSAVFFLVGAFLYSWGIKEFTQRGRETIAPIGLPKGSLISAIITLGALALILFVLWASGSAA